MKIYCEKGRRIYCETKFKCRMTFKFTGGVNIIAGVHVCIVKHSKLEYRMPIGPSNDRMMSYDIVRSTILSEGLSIDGKLALRRHQLDITQGMRHHVLPLVCGLQVRQTAMDY